MKMRSISWLFRNFKITLNLYKIQRFLNVLFYKYNCNFILNFRFRCRKWKKKILFCFLVATTLTYVQSYEFNIYRKIDVKSTNLYPKIETFHPPKGYQPVKGYEPVNYRPNILNYFWINELQVKHLNSLPSVCLNRICLDRPGLDESFEGHMEHWWKIPELLVGSTTGRYCSSFWHGLVPFSIEMWLLLLSFAISCSSCDIFLPCFLLVCLTR